MTIYLDDMKEIQGVYDGLSEQLNTLDLSEMLEKKLRELIEEHQEHFDTETDSSGKGWKPLKPSTIARKGHEMILFETGRLEDSLTERGSADQILDFIKEEFFHGLTFGTGVEYAAFHQNKSGDIYRPPVGVSELFIEKLENDVSDNVVEALKKNA